MKSNALPSTQKTKNNDPRQHIVNEFIWWTYAFTWYTHKPPSPSPLQQQTDRGTSAPPHLAAARRRFPRRGLGRWWALGHQPVNPKDWSRGKNQKRDTRILCTSLCSEAPLQRGSSSRDLVKRPNFWDLWSGWYKLLLSHSSHEFLIWKQKDRFGFWGWHTRIIHGTWLMCIYTINIMNMYPTLLCKLVLIPTLVPDLLIIWEKRIWSSSSQAQPRIDNILSTSPTR